MRPGAPLGWRVCFVLVRSYWFCSVVLGSVTKFLSFVCFLFWAVWVVCWHGWLVGCGQLSSMDKKPRNESKLDTAVQHSTEDYTRHNRRYEVHLVQSAVSHDVLQPSVGHICALRMYHAQLDSKLVVGCRRNQQIGELLRLMSMLKAMGVFVVVVRMCQTLIDSCMLASQAWRQPKAKRNRSVNGMNCSQSRARRCLSPKTSKNHP